MSMATGDPAGVFMLDTNIISHLMRDARGIVAQRARASIAEGKVKMLCTSVVVQSELLFGLSKRPSERLQFAYELEMARLEVFALDAATAPHYANVRAHLERQGTPIGGNDIFIAAHALALNATLVTDNEEEFRRVPGLSVENWLRQAN